MIKSLILSKLDLEDLNFLQNDLKKQNNLLKTIKTVNFYIKKYFVYKWDKEMIPLEQNLQNGNQLGHF